MDQIKAGPLKPLKKTETNAHKGDAAPKTGFETETNAHKGDAAQSGASLGANIPHLHAFLTEKFKHARGTSGDSDWGDDDDETPKQESLKQESFGQARRRFL
jgi:hypothetical protein